MRETLAKAAAAALTGVVVLLSAVFADRRNAEEPDRGPGTGVVARPLGPAPDPAWVARGRLVFEAQSCSRCHALAGEGNPRSPLDGVGARRTSAQLREWATGSGGAAAELPRSTVRAKEPFRALPGEQLDALVAFLTSLR